METNDVLSYSLQRDLMETSHRDFVTSYGNNTLFYRSAKLKIFTPNKKRPVFHGYIL